METGPGAPVPVDRECAGVDAVVPYSRNLRFRTCAPGRHLEQGVDRGRAPAPVA